ncbi:unnamed protein product [Closterium sp. NIES-65]|nr:unnamed protein product [Closterium sp. NIES-65]
MARKPDQVAVINDITKKLSASSLSKDVLNKTLKSAASVLEELQQSAPEPTMSALRPLAQALAVPNFMRHRDRDVRVLLAFCVSEVLRVFAPDPPYDDAPLKSVFELLVGTYEGLEDTSNALYPRRVAILESMARVKTCIIMLDLECTDLILHMFETFFRVVRPEHALHVQMAMVEVMASVIDESEDVSPQLLDAIICNMLSPEKEASPYAYQLAAAVVKRSAERLQPVLQRHLAPAIRTVAAAGGKDGESKGGGGGGGSLACKRYHDVILEVFRVAPSALEMALPQIHEELVVRSGGCSQHKDPEVCLRAVSLLGRLLMVDAATPPRSHPPPAPSFPFYHTLPLAPSPSQHEDPEVRLRAVSLVGKLLMVDAATLQHHYRQLFAEFLRRSNDKSVDVRVKLVNLLESFLLPAAGSTSGAAAGAGSAGGGGGTAGAAAGAGGNALVALYFNKAPGVAGAVAGAGGAGAVGAGVGAGVGVGGRAVDMSEIRNMLLERLLDVEERVRQAAVKALCSVFARSPKLLPVADLRAVADRLRDKKVPVRRSTLPEIARVYREHCLRCAVRDKEREEAEGGKRGKGEEAGAGGEGGGVGNGVEGDKEEEEEVERFEWLPSRMIKCCYFKDCKDFKPQTMDVFFDEELFPKTLPVERRAFHWVYLFHSFDVNDLKAFSHILQNKQILQSSMATFLRTRQELKDLEARERKKAGEEAEKSKGKGKEKAEPGTDGEGGEDAGKAGGGGGGGDGGLVAIEAERKVLQERMVATGRRMAQAAFLDVAKAEEHFAKLAVLKDNNVFRLLSSLMSPAETLTSIQAMREELLKRIGERSHLYDLVKDLSFKLSFHLFGRQHTEHVLAILGAIAAKGEEAAAKVNPEGVEDEEKEGGEKGGGVVGGKRWDGKGKEEEGEGAGGGGGEGEKGGGVVGGKRSGAAGLSEVAAHFPALFEGCFSSLLPLLRAHHPELKEGAAKLLSKLSFSPDSASPHAAALSNQPPDSQTTNDTMECLKQLAMDGTRHQIKAAVAALSASIYGARGRSTLSFIYERAFKSLESAGEQKLQRSLDALGEIARFAPDVWQPHEDEIIKFVVRKLLRYSSFLAQASAAAALDTPSAMATLKSRGIKMLVKTFLPRQATPGSTKKQSTGLQAVLGKLLPRGEVYEDVLSSDADKALLRLTAAKSVVNLATQLDSQITPDLYRLALFSSLDAVPLVRRGFASKLIAGLKDRSVPMRYAAALPLLAAAEETDSEQQTEVRRKRGVEGEVRRYLAEYVDVTRRAAARRSVAGLTGDDGKDREVKREGQAWEVKGGGEEAGGKEAGTSAAGAADSAAAGAGGAGVAGLSTIIEHPEYVLVYLAYVLAQHPQWPKVDAGSAKAEDYEPIQRPLEYLLRALLQGGAEWGRGAEAGAGASRKDRGAGQEEVDNLGAVLAVLRTIKAASPVANSVAQEVSEWHVSLVTTTQRTGGAREAGGVGKEEVDNLRAVLAVLRTIKAASPVANSVVQESFSTAPLAFSSCRPCFSSSDFVSQPPPPGVNCCFGSFIPCRSSPQLFLLSPPATFASPCPTLSANHLLLKLAAVCDIGIAIAKAIGRTRPFTLTYSQPVPLPSALFKSPATLPPPAAAAVASAAGAITPAAAGAAAAGGAAGAENGAGETETPEPTPGSELPLTPLPDGSNLPACLSDLETQFVVQVKPLASPAAKARHHAARAGGKGKRPSRNTTRRRLDGRGEEEEGDEEEDEEAEEVGGDEEGEEEEEEEEDDVVKKVPPTPAAAPAGANEIALRKAYVGRRIKVWWPLDKAYYKGVIKSYQVKTEKHTVRYDDGDKEDLLLHREKFEFIDGLPPPTAASAEKPATSAPESASKGKTAGSHRKGAEAAGADGATSISKSHKKKVPPPAPAADPPAPAPSAATGAAAKADGGKAKGASTPAADKGTGRGKGTATAAAGGGGRGGGSAEKGGRGKRKAEEVVGDEEREGDEEGDETGREGKEEGGKRGKGAKRGRGAGGKEDEGGESSEQGDVEMVEADEVDGGEEKGEMGEKEGKGDKGEKAEKGEDEKKEENVEKKGETEKKGGESEKGAEEVSEKKQKEEKKSGEEGEKGEGKAGAKKAVKASVGIAASVPVAASAADAKATTKTADAKSAEVKKKGTEAEKPEKTDVGKKGGEKRGKADGEEEGEERNGANKKQKASGDGEGEGEGAAKGGKDEGRAEESARGKAEKDGEKAGAKAGDKEGGKAKESTAVNGNSAGEEDEKEKEEEEGEKGKEKEQEAGEGGDGKAGAAAQGGRARKVSIGIAVGAQEEKKAGGAAGEREEKKAAKEAEAEAAGAGGSGGESDGKDKRQLRERRTRGKS